MKKTVQMVQARLAPSDLSIRAAIVQQAQIPGRGYGTGLKPAMFQSRSRGHRRGHESVPSTSPAIPVFQAAPHAVVLDLVPADTVLPTPGSHLSIALKCPIVAGFFMGPKRVQMSIGFQPLQDVHN